VTGTVLVDTNVFTARLRERSPLALHQSDHNADLWIAATAIRWSVPLVAHDAVFTGCPKVRLLTELAG